MTHRGERRSEKRGRERADLRHTFSSELQLDSLDVPRGINLNVVLPLREARFERRSETGHVVDLAVDENQVGRHDLRRRKGE